MMIKIRKSVKKHKIELVFLLLCFSIYSLWALIIPFDAGPDEKMRLLIAQFIYNHGYLPTGTEIEVRGIIWGSSYAFTPFLSGIFSSVMMKIVSYFTVSPKILLLAARLVSVLASTITVALLILISKKIFKGLNQWVFVILVALLPQFVFISSYVNNDAFAIMTTAIIFYSWIIGLENNWDIKSCILLGFGISLCSLSYYNAYGFILCSVIIFVGTNLETINKESIKKTLWLGLLISGIVTVLAGWWFIRNYLIHDGDVLGMKTASEYSEQYAIYYLKPSQRVTPLNMEISYLEMMFGKVKGLNWIRYSYSSFIGVFDMMKIMLDNYMYYIYSGIAALGIAGLIFKLRDRFLLKGKSLAKKNILFYLCIVLTIIIPFILSSYYSYASDYEPQGRYMLSMIIPLSFLLTKGISKLNITINGYILPIQRLIIYLYLGLIVIIYCNKIAYMYM